MALERFDPSSAMWSDVSADHLARYVFASEFVNGKSVVDAGTGFGYGAAILAASGARQVVGVDIDSPTVGKAQQMFRGENLSYAVGTSEALDSTISYTEVICSFENIEHLTKPNDFIKSSAAILSDDGVLLCSTPDRSITPHFISGKPANPYHVNEWYEDEFRAMLEQAYGSVEMYTQVQAWSLVRRQKALLQYSAEIHEHSQRKISRILWKAFRYRFPRLNAHDLFVPVPACFPIYRSSIARLFGEPLCLVAVCRVPKR